jgi:hypothetical protein
VNRPTRNTPDGDAYLDLQMLAKADGRATDELLALYALEGFLDRLSSSSRADDLVLKGGVLLAAYGTRRPTRDIDLPATHVAGDADTVLALVRDIAAVHKDDGLVFDAGSATAEVIRTRRSTPGCGSGSSVTCHARASRSTLTSTLATPSCPRQDRSRYLAFSGGAITVRGYPLSMVFAEKIVTAVQRGTVNTRWRDYADIALLSAAHDVNGDDLAASIDVVATHRNVTLTPLDETLAGYADIAQNKWSAWVRKQRLTDRLNQDFARVLQDVFTFAGPAVSGAIKGLTWVHRVGRWMPR